MTADGLKKKLLPMSETMFYILSSLRQERHGYGIMLHVRKLPRAVLCLGPALFIKPCKSWKETG